MLNPQFSSLYRLLDIIRIDMLPAQVGKRDAALYNDWHGKEPLKRIVLKYGLPLGVVKRIIKNVDDLLLTWFTPERVQMLLPACPPARYNGTSLDVLQLSGRSYTTLYELGATTVEAVCQLTPKEISRVRNSSIRVVAEVENAIAKRGLALRPEIEKR